MYPRGTIAGSHGESESPLPPIETRRRWTGDRDLLLPRNDARVMMPLLLLRMLPVGRSVPNPLPSTPTPSPLAIETALCFRRERILLFRKLVHQVPRVAPEGEVGALVVVEVGGGACQARPIAVFLLVEAVAAVSAAGGGGEGVEGDVGRLAGAAAAAEVERNDGRCEAVDGAALPSTCTLCGLSWSGRDGMWNAWSRGRRA